jgi:hypothetical protein
VTWTGIWKSGHVDAKMAENDQIEDPLGSVDPAIRESDPTIRGSDPAIRDS